MKDSFILYTKYAEQIALLSDAQAGVLFRSLMCYQTGRSLPKMDDLTNIIFTVIRQDIDAENSKYEGICEARKRAGAKGGRPSKSIENKGNKPKKPNGFYENQKNQMVFEEEKLSLLENEEKRTKKEDKVNTLVKEELQERKKETYINNNLTPCACVCGDEVRMSHEEVMKEYGISRGLTDVLKEFLRQCYINGHLVSNAKLEDIVFRLVDDLDDDPSRIKCVERAISGGYFDVKT